MPHLLSHLPVRIKLSIILVVLILLLSGSLTRLINTSQQFTGDMQVIKIVGDMRATITNIELLARQITAAELDNRQIIRTIQSELAYIAAYAQTLVSLRYTSPNLSRHQFSLFLKDAQSRPSTALTAVQYVAFVNRVTNDQRAMFEQSVAREGFLDFSIYEMDSNQQPTPAQQRAEYFPIHYVVPLDANRAALGFDQASDPIRRAALEQAATAGKSVLTALTNNTDDPVTFLLFAPVYASAAIPETPEMRRAALEGFIVISLDIKPIMQEAMAQLSAGSLILQVEDVTQPATPLLAYKNTRLPTGSLRVALNVNALERAWKVTIAQPVNTEAARQELDAAMTALNQSIDALEPSVMDSKALLSDIQFRDLRYAYTDLKTARLSLKWDVSQFMEAQDLETTAERLPSLQKGGKKIYEDLGMILAILQEKTRLQAERNIQTSLIAGGVGILAVLAGLYVVYHIIRDLRRVKQTALRLAEGDLDARNQVRSRDELGQIGSTLNTMADHLQELFQTVRDNEARYRILAENVADVIAQTDADGNFLYVSPACRRVLGYEPEEMVGTNRRDYLNPDDYTIVANIAPDDETYEYRLRRKDGGFIWMESTFRPLDNGEIISVARDVTERKAAALELEAARLEREHLQEQVIEAQKQAIRELSSPVIPLTDHIIIMPLIGSIDTTRARDITRGLLAGISQHRAHVAIIDVTGVPIVDSGVADHLNRTVQAARLKGTRTIVSGISAAVAEAIVDLGIDWSGIQTVPDLQTGLQLALGDSAELPLNGREKANGANGHK